MTYVGRQFPSIIFQSDCLSIESNAAFKSMKQITLGRFITAAMFEDPAKVGYLIDTTSFRAEPALTQAYVGFTCALEPSRRNLLQSRDKTIRQSLSTLVNQLPSFVRVQRHRSMLLYGLLLAWASTVDYLSMLSVRPFPRCCACFELLLMLFATYTYSQDSANPLIIVRWPVL